MATVETNTATMNEKPAADTLLPAVRTSDVQLDRLARLGTWLEASESDRGDAKAKGATAALRLYYCEQLGLPPWAVAEVVVIKGKLSIGAQLMRALADRAGYRVIRKGTADRNKSCTAALLKADTMELLGEATYTIEDAQRAVLANKDNWKRNPERMLWARASKNVINDFAPHVSLGIVLDDEISEITGQNVEAYEETTGYLEAEDPADGQLEDYEPANIPDPDLERIPFGEPDDAA